VIFSLFNTIEGYQEDKKFETERPKKTIPQMEADKLSKACLRLSYGVISKLFEMLINVDDENYLNVFLPLVYYLTIYKNQSRYFFEYFKPFKYILNKVY
jgi:hypothetical protein